jgi:hypothetical protein
MRTWSIGGTAAVLALAAMLAATPAGVAKDGDVLAAGTCTKSSTSKLKLSPEDGRMEVEFEVDQNRNGLRWSVVISRGGNAIARLSRVTRPPSGSFEARVVANGRSFSARATSRSGEVCRARASI